MHFLGNAVHELLVGDEFHAAIVVLDDGAEAFDPVAGVEVMDVFDLFVGGGVDVAADDAFAFALVGEFLQLHFVLIDERNGGLHFAFDRFADGVVFFSEQRSPFVVDAIDGEQAVVAKGPKHGEPAVVGRHAIKAIAVDDEVAFPLRTAMDVFFDDANGAEGER